MDSMRGRLSALETGPPRQAGTEPPEARAPQSATALKKAQTLAGRPPARQGEQGATRKARAEAVDLEEEAEEEEAGHPEEETADAMLKKALAHLLHQQDKAGKSKKKKIAALPESASNTDEEQENSDGGEAEARPLAGAKGTAAAERYRASLSRHPKEFAERMEKNMKKALPGQEGDADLALRYVKEVVPVGGQRTLGFMVTIMAEAHRASAQGKHDRARCLLLLGMMAAEQQCLDENWMAAWRLTGLAQPPWAHWSKMDVASIKRDHPRSRMAEATWLGAIIAELKDEDFLIKRRKPKGKGKGEEGTS